MSPPICRIPFSNKGRIFLHLQWRHRIYSTSQQLHPPCTNEITVNITFSPHIFKAICRKLRSHLFCLKLLGPKKEHTSMSSGNKIIFFITVCIITYHSFQNGTFLHVNDNITLSSSNHCHCKDHNKVACWLFTSLCYFGIFTSCRHANVIIDAIWITAEFLQAVNGALSHYRFPSKWSVVNYLQHNGRGVYILFWKQLNESARDHIRNPDMKYWELSDH